MKLPWDKKYLIISFHVILTVVIIYVLSLFLGNVREYIGYFAEFFDVVITVLSPLLIAILIAYLVDPSIRFFEKRLNKLKFLSHNKISKTNKRLLPTIITFVIIFLIIGLAIKFVVGKVGSLDLEVITKSINDYIRGFSDLLMMFKVELADFGILEGVDPNMISESFLANITSWRCV